LRPVLKPALRRLWRSDDTLQLGAGPACGVVLEGVDAAVSDVLTLLDGARTTEEVVAAAESGGVPAADVRDLLMRLRDANALDDAGAVPRSRPVHERVRLQPDLATLSLLTSDPGAAARSLDNRRDASVLVVGAGRVGALVASLLAAAGVGHVSVRDQRLASVRDAVPGGLTPRDDGQTRALAAMAAAQRAGGASVDGATRPPDATDCRTADLAVVACDEWLVPPVTLVELFAIVGLPYLVTGVRETYGVVGPLVLPGRSSCPRCQDLHRADRDPAWPVLAAQLAAENAFDADAACDVTLAAGVAALTAGQVLAHLIGPGLTRCVDATLELRLPEWTVRRRTWSPHPECPCGVAASRAAEESAARAARVEAALAAAAKAQREAAQERLPEEAQQDAEDVQGDVHGDVQRDPRLDGRTGPDPEQRKTGARA
jgi:bacteriocin biosynthesis cyclodehydratase domain-containing protein